MARHIGTKIFFTLFVQFHCSIYGFVSTKQKVKSWFSVVIDMLDNMKCFLYMISYHQIIKRCVQTNLFACMVNGRSQDKQLNFICLKKSKDKRKYSILSDLMDTL